MKFLPHSDMQGKHAFLAPSNYAWLGYDEDRLLEAYASHSAAVRGERLHEFAKICIQLRQRLPKNKLAVNNFVNDAIGFNMAPEVCLYFSDNCFGTADAIVFSEKDKTLRIHDLKTGRGRVSVKQLIIYAALFCLEYNKDPNEIVVVLRIYQNSGAEEFIPESAEISRAMNVMRRFNELINDVEGAGYVR